MEIMRVNEIIHGQYEEKGREGKKEVERNGKSLGGNKEEKEPITDRMIREGGRY